MEERMPGAPRGPFILPAAWGSGSRGACVLGCGADGKSTLCIVAGGRAWVSADMGDPNTPAGSRDRAAWAGRLRGLAGETPRIAAHDLHPDYASTRYAFAQPFARRVAVQHHHAHVAACLAEHGLTGTVLGVALDGMGLGDDGTLWGGELLAADAAGYERIGRFKPYRLPGGDQAARNPERMALSCLVAEGVEPGVAERILPGMGERGRALRSMIERGVRSPLTSSAGRLFDAASAMLGLCRRDAAEAEAAIALQRAAETDGSDAAYPFELRDGTLDFGPMIRAMVGDILSGAGAAKPARMFHNTLAAAVAAGCERARCERGIGRAALVGGVFQNRLLGGLVADALRAGGFSVYSPRLLPPTDAALSLGQAAVAWAGGGTGGAGE